MVYGLARFEIDPQESDVAESNESQAIRLKDPFIAGLLAWLIPGLGHFYQGRNAKGALYAICILGTFVYGLYLGGSKEVGWGRAVYYSFRPNDWRLPWLCQIGVGLPTVPMTLFQSTLKDNRSWMASWRRPRCPIRNRGKRSSRPAARPKNMNLAWINRLLPRYFEMGTVYTMIAGLLNILAVYDACCGPVPAETKNEDERPQGKPDGSRRDGAIGEEKS